MIQYLSRRNTNWFVCLKIRRNSTCLSSFDRKQHHKIKDEHQNSETLNRFKAEIRFTHKKKSEENYKTMQNIDKNIYLYMKRHFFNNTSDILRRSSIDHDVRLYHMTHIKRNSKIKRYIEQINRYTKQMFSKHNRSL